MTVVKFSLVNEFLAELGAEAKTSRIACNIVRKTFNRRLLQNGIITRITMVATAEINGDTELTGNPTLPRRAVAG